MEQIYNKLVRDNIPDIIRSNNETPIIRELSDIEYKQELERKLLEEYNEVINTCNREERIEELADMIEVISALANVENSSLEEVISVGKKKSLKRGSFNNKIFLEKVVDKE